MARFELKFKAIDSDKITIETFVNSKNDSIVISMNDLKEISTIVLDKSTAIKFAKTLRTEINKITESEVKNV
jgi:hypothetical protein